MRFEIKTTWDGQAIDHEPAKIKLLPHDDNSFQMIVEGKFFGDPNPGGEAGQPFMGLWNHEGPCDSYSFPNNVSGILACLFQ